MTLATRCNSCGTIFRVVQDQLKVSEGWVRCGRCNEVFNALETLFDLTREAPPKFDPPSSRRVLEELEQRRIEEPAEVAPSAASVPPDAPSAPPVAPPPARPRPPAEDIADLDEDDRIASRFFESSRETPRRGASDPTDFADAQFPPEALGVEPGEPPPPVPTPDFVRQAQRQARWRSPLARTLLAFVALLLATTLLAQVGHHFRDTIAVRWPVTQPWLARWCSELAGCRLEPPRRIDDIAVDATALTRDASVADAFRLAVTLRNRGALPVAMPAVELSLTDAGGQLLVRRVLMPADFRATASAIPAGGEAPLQALLATGSNRVVGYTVEVFYP